MVSQPSLRYDALVLGGGIAGLEAALNLADQDFSVAVRGKRRLHRRQDDQALQGLSHPGLLQLHHHPQDGGRGPSSQHHPLHLLRVAVPGAPGRRFGSRDSPKAPLCGRGEVHRLPPVRISVSRAGAGCRARGVCGPESHLHSLLQRHSPEGPDRSRRIVSCAAGAPRSAPPRPSTTFRSRKISP